MHTVGPGQGGRRVRPWAFPTGPCCVSASSAPSVVLLGAISIINQSHKKLRPALTGGDQSFILAQGALLAFPSCTCGPPKLVEALKETCPTWQSLPGTGVGNRIRTQPPDPRCEGFPGFLRSGPEVVGDSGCSHQGHGPKQGRWKVDCGTVEIFTPSSGFQLCGTWIRLGEGEGDRQGRGWQGRLDFAKRGGLVEWGTVRAKVQGQARLGEVREGAEEVGRGKEQKA